MGGDENRPIAPDQSKSPGKALLKQILMPSERIRPGYAPTTLAMKNGQPQIGLLKDASGVRRRPMAFVPSFAEPLIAHQRARRDGRCLISRNHHAGLAIEQQRMKSIRRPSILFLVMSPASRAEPANRPAGKHPAVEPLFPKESMERLKVVPGFRIEHERRVTPWGEFQHA